MTVINAFIVILTETIKRILGTRYQIRVEQIRGSEDEYTSSLIMYTDISESSRIYLEPFYHAWLSGGSVETMALHITRQRNTISEAVFMRKANAECWDMAKQYILCRLTNRDRYKHLLEYIPHRAFLDMEITYYMTMPFKEGGNWAAMPITNLQMEMWGVTEDDLSAAASKNMELGSFYTITPIEEEIQCYGANSPRKETTEKKPVYIIRSSYGDYGASSMLHPGVLKKGAEMIGGSFYIFPSSIHQIIIAPQTINRERTELQETVMNANRTYLLPEKYLSDNVYYYDESSGEVRKAFSNGS